MADLQVLFRIDFLPVSSVDLLTISSVRHFDIRGEGYLLAQQVMLNGDIVNFRILSDRRILAAVPEGMLALDTVEVTTTNSSSSTTFELDVTLTDKARQISGVERVIQKLTKVLLTTPFSDARAPNLGGGLQAILTRATSIDESSVAGDLAIVLERTVQQIQTQERDLAIPDSEKLGSARILDVSYKAGEGLVASYEVTNLLGETSVTGISNG